MLLLRQAGRAVLCWTLANPLKAAQLAIALAVLGTTLYKTRRLDGAALKRVVRVFL